MRTLPRVCNSWNALVCCEIAVITDVVGANDISYLNAPGDGGLRRDAKPFLLLLPAYFSSKPCYKVRQHHIALRCCCPAVLNSSSPLPLLQAAAPPCCLACCGAAPAAPFALPSHAQSLHQQTFPLPLPLSASLPLSLDLSLSIPCVQHDRSNDSNGGAPGGQGGWVARPCWAGPGGAVSLLDSEWAAAGLAGQTLPRTLISACAL